MCFSSKKVKIKEHILNKKMCDHHAWDIKFDISTFVWSENFNGFNPNLHPKFIRIKKIR